jgi:nitrous oxidase accessory protein NosD
VNTSGQHRVVVRGPGLVQRFRGHGVQVTASNEARVEGLTVSTNCGSGIFVLGTSFGALIEGNTTLRNGSTVAGASCGGI